MHSMLDSCKGGRQEYVHSRVTIYHQDRDGDDILVSRDVRGWWVARGISERAARITTGQGDLVLCLFDSQIYILFLFHLIA